MPYQIKNGIIYSGNAVTLTQAQYDALTTAEKNNGTVYYIYDSDAMIEAQEVGLDGGNVEDLAGSVATFETSPSTAVHAEGEYILYQAQLYKVTSAIAVGEDLTVGSNIEATNLGNELNNGLIVPLMSNTEFHAVNQTIAQGSYYECPVDGFYTWAVYGGNNATAMLFLDSDNNITKAFYASNTDNANHIVSFPFKAGTKVYTRSSFGNYVVKGYWAL